MVIVKFIYNILDVERVLSELISFIFNKKEAPIYKYIKNNMNDFMRELLKEDIEYFNDKSDDVISLLNDTSIEYSNIISYILRLNNWVEEVRGVDNPEYMKALLNAGKVKYSVQNILDYFAVHGLAAELVQFINSSTKTLDFGWVKESEDSQSINFWTACISCGDLSDEKYSEILTTMGYYCINFNKKGIAKNKMMILVNKGIIRMTRESLEFIRINYPDCVLEYIKRNPYEYVELAKGEVAASNEVIEILELDILADDSKKELLAEIEDEVTITGMNYSDEVILYILDNNFCLGDLSGLCERYESYSDGVKKSIIRITEENLDEVIENVKTVNVSLLMELISKVSIELLKRVSLLAHNMKHLTSRECLKCLLLVNAKEISKLFDKQARPRIPVDEVNQLIMCSLKENGYINDFSIDKEKGIYRYLRGGRILSGVFR